MSFPALAGGRFQAWPRPASVLSTADRLVSIGGSRLFAWGNRETILHHRRRGLRPAGGQDLRRARHSVRLLRGACRCRRHLESAKPARGLRLDLSQFLEETDPKYPDFDIPEEWPHYLSRAQAQEYLRAYAREFGLYDRITFNSPVASAERVDGRWRIQIEGEGNPRFYDGLVVANGHHWDPNWPSYPGTFTARSSTRTM